MHPSKSSLILLCALLTATCAEREPVNILDRYEIAFSSDRPIRYYYHRMPDDDTTWTDYRPVVQDGQKYVVQEEYENNKLQWRAKYKVIDQQQQAVEKVIFFERDSITGEREAVTAKIMKHARRTTSAGHPGSLFVDYYETSLGIASKIMTENEVDSTQLYHYDGRDIPSIRIKIQGRTITYFKYFPLYFHELDIDGYAIYSQDVGMTYFWSKSSDGTLHSQKLVGMQWFE